MTETKLTEAEDVQNALIEALQAASVQVSLSLEGDVDVDEILEEFGDEIASPIVELKIDRATSFEEGLVMTSDKGLTLRVADGREFQITIVRSR